MQRVVIVGSGGAGKSTLAADLGLRTGLPVVHLDRHFWHPGWVETPRDEWRLVQRKLFAADTWIADGNYSATLDERLPLADTVVFCDFPTWRTLPRVLRRTFGNWGQAVQADGCPEHLDRTFVLWVFRYRRRSRPKLLRNIAGLAPDAHVYILTSPRAVKEFLDSVTPR